MAERVGGGVAPPKKAAKPKPKSTNVIGDPGFDYGGFYDNLIPKWAADDNLYKGLDLPGDSTDWDAILQNDPRRITSEKQMQENIAAAGLAREAAIKRAMLALTGSEKDIARGAGFQQADLGANLAGRGMLNSGGYGAGTMRVEENRQRAMAQAAQAAQDVSDQAYATEADIARQARQGYESYLAGLADELAKDPRYRPKDEPAETPKPGTSTSNKPSTTASNKGATAPSKPTTVPPPSQKKKWLKNKQKAGRM